VPEREEVSSNQPPRQGGSVVVSSNHQEEVMPSTITTRLTKSGPRYVVRYRLGGRTYPIQHAGSFKTLRDAKTRRDFVAGELAAGRNPAVALRALAEAPRRRTFREWADAYKASRIDVAAKTTKTIDSYLRVLVGVFGDRDPAQITFADVQGWVAASGLKASSVRQYLSTLRAVLDYADLTGEQNPTRDPRLRLPRQERELVEPPSAADVETIVANVPKRWRLGLRTLAETGMRVGEAHSLEWQDVDVAGSRFRIRHGKTAAARRFVAVPAALMDEISASAPPDDRTPERRVFPGFTPSAAKNAMRKACENAGIAHFHPHDLRHRYASVKIAEGVPVTQVAAQLGHSRNSLTLDTYSHVLMGD
jgi:integrase